MSFPKLERLCEYYRKYEHQKKALDQLDGLIKRFVPEDDLERVLKLWRGSTPAVVHPLQKGIDLIKEFEGCHLVAYPDPLSGNLPITIGWGSTKNFNGKPFKLGDRITQQVADDLLKHQVEYEFLPTLAKTVPHWDDLNNNQKSALLSFAWNLGKHFATALSGFESMQRMLRNKEYKEAREVFVKYRNPGTKVEAGLKRRRLAEAELFGTHD